MSDTGAVDPTGADKVEVRRAALARRSAVAPTVRSARDTEVTRILGGIVTERMVVCAFVPDDDETGDPALPDLLRRRGVHVLLPVSPAVGPLSWAPYAGPAEMTPGRFGIPVPTSAPEGPERIAEVDLVLVPAVAVDRTGMRLGRGGGYYDRSLALVGPGTRVLALVDSENVLDRVPADPHDLPVHGAVTPDGLLDFGTWHSPE